MVYISLLYVDFILGASWFIFLCLIEILFLVRHGLHTFTELTVF